MIYLNTDALQRHPTPWDEIVDAIEYTTRCIDRADFAQPVKPYLRYRNPKNRIIAMPAFVGGDVNLAGIKWIASFPDNIRGNLPRAHSVTILNHADTGQPVCIINTPLVSAIRTAGVSGLMLKHFLAHRDTSALKVGIAGFGVIGRLHLDMLMHLFGDRIGRVRLFDLRPVEVPDRPGYREKTTVCASWEEAYLDSDVFITCTVSDGRYIDKAPPKGSLQLNVSLRDYQSQLRSCMDLIVVDNWEEVCRENTDIEMMHKLAGLQQADTRSVADIVCRNGFAGLGKDHTVMFNPMGMSVFDIAVGSYYYRQALAQNTGQVLAD